MSYRVDAAGSTTPCLQQRSPLENYLHSSASTTATVAVGESASSQATAINTPATTVDQPRENGNQSAKEKPSRKRQLRELTAQLETVTNQRASDLQVHKQMAENFEAATLVNTHLRQAIMHKQCEVAALSNSRSRQDKELNIAKGQLYNAKINHSLLRLQLHKLKTDHAAKEKAAEKKIDSLQRLLESVNEKLNAMPPRNAELVGDIQLETIQIELGGDMSQQVAAVEVDEVVGDDPTEPNDCSLLPDEQASNEVSGPIDDPEQ